MAGKYRCECPAGSTLHINGHDCTGKQLRISNYKSEMLQIATRQNN